MQLKYQYLTTVTVSCFEIITKANGLPEVPTKDRKKSLEVEIKTMLSLGRLY